MSLRYISTRGAAENRQSWSPAEAVLTGIAADGGLLVPESIPRLTTSDVAVLRESDYPGRAALIINRFLPDFSEQELRLLAAEAYDAEIWGENPAPLSQLNAYNDRAWMLELWHGPSAAFKDFGLRMLPLLTALAEEKLGISGRRVVLAATSGDTGSATLAGFAGQENTRTIVCYPEDGVAPLQQLQMTTTTAANASVLAIRGNFDDAQREVKGILGSEAVLNEAAAAGVRFISANSINWGRLVSQIVYYWSAYCDLLNNGMEEGSKVNFAVPTGNFGDILACWYAGQSGLPLGKLICGSNSNNVLSDFLRTGVYDSRRGLKQTIAPSMDILVSSNLERLLFEVAEQDGALVASWMRELEEKGSYRLPKHLKRRLQSAFVGGYTEDKGIRRTILDVYDATDHVIDPHTAVGFDTYSRYQRRSKDSNVIVYVATASPFKFPRAVCAALYPDEDLAGAADAALLERLAEESGYEIPACLSGLEEREVTQRQVIEQGELAPAVRNILDLGQPASDLVYEV